MHVLIPTSSFDFKVSVPDISGSVTSQSVITGSQALLNRTEYLFSSSLDRHGNATTANGRNLIDGNIDLNNGGSLTFGHTSGLFIDSGELSSSLNCNIQLNLPTASFIQLAGASLDLNTKARIHIDDGSSINARIAGALSASVNRAIVASAAGALTTISGSGTVFLGGGPQDLTFNSQSVAKLILPLATALPSNWAPGVGGYPAIGVPTTTSTQNVYLTIPGLEKLNGAFINRITVVFAVGNSHSNPPAVLPSIDVRRTSFGANGLVGLFTTPVDQSLLSTAPQHHPTPSPNTGAGWFSSGNLQTWDFVPDQFQTINTNQYTYYMVLQDESGTSSVAGNVYYGFQIFVNTAADLRY